MINAYKHLSGIPGDAGLPFFGHFFSWIKDASGFYQGMQKKYGDVFRYKALWNGHVVVLGPTANKFILVDESKFMESKEAWEIALGELFPNGLMLMDGQQHKYHRAIMQEAFKKGPMQGYLDDMPAIIKTGLDKIGDQKQIKAFPYFKELTLQLAATIFFGLDPDDDITEINTAISDIVTASTAVPIKIPFGKYHKGINARQKLITFFKANIDDRRSNPGTDLFSKFCSATSEDGNQFTDEQIIDHLIFVLMAAHDTTAITLTMMSYLLAKNSDWQQKLRTEIHQIDLGNHIKINDLRALDNLGLVIKETLRLYTPLITVGRKNTRDLIVNDIKIPKNSSISVVMRMTHYDERSWENPKQFDPTRFSSEKSEHQKCPYAYAPFGAGPHHCIGFQFAEMQIKLVMMELLKRYELSVPDSYEIPVVDVPLTHPKDDLPLSLLKI